MSYSLKKTGLECLIVGSLYFASPLANAVYAEVPSNISLIKSQVASVDVNNLTIKNRHDYKKDSLVHRTNGIVDEVSRGMQYAVCFGFPTILFYGVFFHPYLKRKFIRADANLKDKDIGSSV